MKFNTLLLHGKQTKGYEYNATLPPIAQNSAFIYDSPEAQEKVFAHQAAGFVYSRIGNPTVSAFERRINELEGGMGCVACSSGMSALTSAILNVVCSGDEIIVANNLYGGTLNLFKDLEKFGITARYVSHMRADEIEPVINENTKLIFGEIISNPSLEVIDVKTVADLAHDHGIAFLVDSTIATPYIAKPLSLGADIVIHSTSKYINGGGNSIGGVVIDGGKFDWDFDKYKALQEFKQFGNMAFLVRLRTDLWENFGGCAAPFNAYLNIVGMETLGLRMAKICENAATLAKELNDNDINVNYLTLPDHPFYDICNEQLGGKGGGILTFRTGSKQRAYEVLNKLKYVTIASNIGDLRTLAIHPASTLYRKSDDALRQAAGVYDDTIRVSVGIEDAQDLVEDFLQALAV